MPDNTATDTWDIVVIGGAPPGENVAQYATQGSDRTAVIIEKELVGGECSFWACMPSKALLRPISVLDNARNLPGVQSLVGDHSLDNAAVLRRRDEIVHHHDDTSQVDWATSVGIDVVRGHGRLAGDRTVEVTAADGSVRTIHARLAVCPRHRHHGNGSARSRPSRGPAVDLPGRHQHARGPAPDRHHRRRSGGLRGGDLAARDGGRGDDHRVRAEAVGAQRGIRQ